LATALMPLRLVNRSNVGVPRMYETMLLEGKEPPIISDTGYAVSVTFMRSDFSFPFRSFVAETAANGYILSLETLLIMQYLLRHGEIDITVAAHICQQNDREVLETIRRMEKRLLLESFKFEKKNFWRLIASVERRISDDSQRHKATDAALSRIISMLKEKADSGSVGLSTKEITDVLDLNRDQVKYLTQRLRQQGIAKSTGAGRGAKWELIVH
jgi:ATP-dependent DNA helicase RecG